MKIIFAGTPDFAVAPLLTLYKDHDIVAVFTQPDRKAGRGKKLTPPPVKVEAEKLDIPVFQPTTLKDKQADIAVLNADVMVVVAYGMLLPQDILDTPKFGCINIHASILPRWRGAAPIQRAIEAGDAETGVSIMQMELGLDTGPVFQVLTIPITNSDTSASLHDKLAELGAQGIVETLAKLEESPSIKPVEQDDSKSNYAKKITKQEAIIDWSNSANQIDQQIRAFIPWPICQTSHDSTRIRVWEASVSNSSNKTNNQVAIGEITAITEQHIEVNCGKGTLFLKKLQRDGSKPLPIKEFCNGYPLNIGDQFASK